MAETLCHVGVCRAAPTHQMAGGAGCNIAGCCWVWGGGGGYGWGGGCFSTSEAEELTGPEHRGEAAGGPQPQMVFHLLCLHTEQPSSQLWEAALRASSDPHGSAFVTTRDPSFGLCSVSVSFLLFCALLFFFFRCCIYRILITSLLICLLLFLPSLSLFMFLFFPQRKILPSASKMQLMQNN